MAAKKICIWTFRAAEIALFFFAYSINQKFGIDLLWAIVYSPYGIARLIIHGTPALTATAIGMLGGMLSVFNLWLFAYYDLEYYSFVRRSVERLWHFSPVETSRVGWRWSLPYLFVLLVCVWDVWFGLATAKFFRLNRWIILAICGGVSGIKCLISGGALVSIRYFDRVHGTNVHFITGVLFSILVAGSTAGILWKKIRAWRQKPRQLTSPA